ncbi:uncharacterized protein DS421_11g335620 [Arachis hypogaea]|nr:uncharacterized protein DS421_11g335620 [Arachis hypogaea]
MNTLKTPCFLDDPYRKGVFLQYTFVFSSYFVLYFYLKESLGKESNFHRAKKRISMSLVN